MTTTTRTTPVEVETTIDASPETIFAFLIEPEKMVRWMGVSTELDPRPGGTYKLTAGNGQVAIGEYLEVHPFDRVVFTFGWDGPDAYVPPGSSTVEITLTPQGKSTLVKLVHSGLGELTLDDHTQGWNHYLGRLAIAATGGDPGPDA
jgi:uncharacterized protein YndB with AHSA1/START domain